MGALSRAGRQRQNTYIEMSMKAADFACFTSTLKGLTNRVLLLEGAHPVRPNSACCPGVKMKPLRPGDEFLEAILPEHQQSTPEPEIEPGIERLFVMTTPGFVKRAIVSWKSVYLRLHPLSCLPVLEH